MDPEACLQMIEDALQDNDISRADDHYEDLAEWLRKGGFAPDWITSPSDAVDFFNDFKRFGRNEETS